MVFRQHSCGVRGNVSGSKLITDKHLKSTSALIVLTLCTLRVLHKDTKRLAFSVMMIIRAVTCIITTKLSTEPISMYFI
jgi:hypothetical protein